MNSSRYDLAMALVLKNEGGYVNNPSDKGGETKYGISKRAYPDLDIKNLTKEYAMSLYKRDYWEKFPYYEIKDDKVAIKIFDLSVNMGLQQAIKLLQRAISACGFPLVDDGIAGKLTLAAINKPNPNTLLDSLRWEAANYYQGLANKNPSQKVFLKGWLNRAYS